VESDGKDKLNKNSKERTTSLKMPEGVWKVLDGDLHVTGTCCLKGEIDA
jgi:hypothetical protein